MKRVKFHEIVNTTLAIGEDLRLLEDEAILWANSHIVKLEAENEELRTKIAKLEKRKKRADKC